MLYRCIRGKGSGQIHPWGPSGDAPAPELDSQVREQTSLKDGEWYVLAERMSLPEGQYWFFLWRGKAFCSAPTIVPLYPSSGWIRSSRSPSLVPNQSQVSRTFSLKPWGPSVLGWGGNSIQRNFPQIPRVFPASHFGATPDTEPKLTGTWQG